MKARLTTLVLTGTLAVGGLAAGAVVVPAMAATATESPSATTDAPSTTTDETTDDETTDDESDAARLADRVARIREALNDLVSAGTIDEAQADAVSESLAEQLPGRGPGGPDGPGGHGGHGGGGGFGGGGGGLQLETAAAALGITTDELRAALVEGQSLAAVAAEQGVGTDTLIAALVDAAEVRIAEKVASGDLSQAEADERTAELTARVTEAVEREGVATRGDRGGSDTTTAPTTEPTTEPSVTS